MKTIVTALGNKTLNEQLKLVEDFEILIDDIQYKEGIIEYLEKENLIDYLIISELLPEKLEIKKLIENIRVINPGIQVIVFLENRNEELENYFYAKGINNIFYHNETQIEEIIDLLKNNNPNNELKKEVEKLKKILLEKENKKKIIKNKEKKEKNKVYEKEIICVTGTSGVGKSIFTINYSKSISKNKILIIDFDVLNNSLHTILGIKKYPQKIRNKIKNNNLLEEIKVEELIIKINKKIDLISGINLLFDSKYKISSVKIKNILSKLKEKYDVIIIDTSSECFFDYTKEVIKNSDYNIFITEANLSEIKKAKILLNIYINDWNISKNKFNILFNKCNNNSIDFSILKNIFLDFNILGSLSENSQYNLMINKNNIEIINDNIKKEYLKINNKIEKKDYSKKFDLFKRINKFIKLEKT